MAPSYEKELKKILSSSSISGMSKKNKRKPIGKALRDLVWIKYMGNKTQAKCYCCKIRPIHFTNFHVGHNKAVAKGGKNHITNLRPICSTCNRGMGTTSIEQYRKKHFAKPKKRVVKKKTTKKTTKKTSAKKQAVKK